MNNEIINIKGVLYGWETVTIDIKGVELQGIKAISYDDKGKKIEENITHEEAEKRILNNK